MRLAAFIRTHTEQIVNEWETFARTLVPGKVMSPRALRDHIKAALVFIADDMDSLQSAGEQVKKSHGGKLRTPLLSSAEVHASLRLSSGFNMDEMVSEYRALRASISKLWEKHPGKKDKVDIADLIRFNEAIDQQLTEAISHFTKTLEHSKDIFLGILSHDLRNPLGTARMSAELMLKLGVTDERQTMLASQVVESVDQAVEILTYLLDLTRARLGSGISITKEPMDMGFASRLMIHEIRTLHPDRAINLEISGDTRGEWDKPRIGQVFSNLLSNAVQYSFPNSPIDIIIHGDKQEITISVHNDGVPIPADAIGRIFDSLTRGGIEEGTEHPPGKINLGLGLYITKEIVVSHGGTIEVTSSAKAGTTFIVRFPRLASASNVTQVHAA